MVFSVVGLVLACCFPLSIVGVILARLELNAMNDGRTDPAKRSTAMGAFLIGLVGTVISVGIMVLWLVLFSVSSTTRVG